jgi:membrane protein YqaA with SNARE-associated domain
MMSLIAAYGGLFLTALLAATIVPAQSEAVLAGLLLSGNYSPWVLLLVASTGNILGSIINWVFGRGIDRFRDRKWFPVKQHQLDRAQDWYRRYGRWSLLLSWVPFIGDPLTVAAGVMREKFWIFVGLVSIAKIGRYLVLMAIVLKLF